MRRRKLLAAFLGLESSAEHQARGDEQQLGPRAQGRAVASPPHCLQQLDGAMGMDGQMDRL